jgi:hypothetical protein
MTNREDFVNQLNEMNKLKKIIRQLVKEAATSDPTSPSPHPHTGINVLEDLLNKIIPVIQADFKILTTSPEQRQSFRAHLINGIQNAIIGLKTTVRATPQPAGLQEKMYTLSEALDIDVGEDDVDPAMFIDIEKKKPTEQEKFSSGVANDVVGNQEDLITGRNQAFMSFKKIAKSIIDAYDLLSNPQDQDLFQTYLITNLKLYFDRFEDQLASQLMEPTTPEYEDAKKELTP